MTAIHPAKDRQAAAETRSDRRFCAVDSLAIGDPLVGSADHVERNLLISWPRAKWQRSLRRASDMSDTVATLLEAMAEAGRRVNLIHRHGEDAEHHSRLTPVAQCAQVAALEWLADRGLHAQVWVDDALEQNGAHA